MKVISKTFTKVSLADLQAMTRDMARIASRKKYKYDMYEYKNGRYEKVDDFSIFK